MAQSVIPKLIISALVVSVAACSSQSVSSSTGHVTETKQAHSQDYQKPGAAIRFQLDNAAPFAAGEIRTVTVTVFNEYDAGDLSVKIGDAVGVKVFSDIREHRFSMNGASSHSFDVQVQAEQNGMFNIPLIATANLDNGQTMMRAGSLPVQAGEQAFSKRTTATDVESDANQLSEENVSGGIVDMEAEETIRTED